jgi:hypothetical protein
VLIDNTNSTATYPRATTLPPTLDTGEDLRPLSVIVTNKAVVGMPADCAVRSFSMGSGCALELKGRTLTVWDLVITNRVYGPGIYTTNELAPRVTDSIGIGRVVVRTKSSLFLFR